MRLSQARKGNALSPPLPQPFPALEGHGLIFRRGQSSLTVAAPGVGKSVVWLNFALRMRVPTAYFSADTDRHDVTMRLLAALTHYDTRTVEQYISDNTAGFDTAKILRAADHIQWAFEPTITGEYVTERLRAFAEVHGEYPALTVIDNLSNTVQNQSDEYAELRQVVQVMQRVARATGSHVAMLHHATGEYEDGSKPIPQSGALGKIAKVPEQMLTLYRAGDGKVGVCCVKNRSGPADPSGKSPVMLNVSYPQSLVMGFKEAS